MKHNSLLCLLLTLLFACKSNVETIKPKIETITESVYASGVVKSKNQYQVFSSANGIISAILVKEGDVVKKGTPLIAIANESSLLNLANAKIAAEYADLKSNSSKVEELTNNIAFAKAKMENDSILFFRQKNLWSQKIGSRVELEQRELAYKNAVTTYKSLLLKYDDLLKQLQFSSEQSKNNLRLSQKMENDFIVKSELNGKVYSISKEKGEMVNTQMPLAIIGSASEFVLELQVDEYDIVRISPGQKIIITLDSYKEKVFEGIVDKVDPIMNERSKTFTVKALFTDQPPVLYPNLTVEANIVIKSKENVLTLPRNYISKDKYVYNANGEKIEVEIGLKDFQKAEIIKGVTKDSELVKPVE